jgi:hypothetical protein
MAVNGRAKGSGYERAIAKLIVEAFEAWGITAQHCFRTPLSGGHIHASKTDPGDLQIHPKLQKLFPFSAECKCYRKISWIELLKPSEFSGHKYNRSSGKILDWWKQACLAAQAKKNKMPLLIMKQNSSSSYCLIRQKDYLAITAQSSPNKKSFITVMVATRVNGEPVRLLLFSELLSLLVNVAKLEKKNKA